MGNKSPSMSSENDARGRKRESVTFRRQNADDTLRIVLLCAQRLRDRLEKEKKQPYLVRKACAAQIDAERTLFGVMYAKEDTQSDFKNATAKLSSLKDFRNTLPRKKCEKSFDRLDACVARLRKDLGDMSEAQCVAMNASSSALRATSAALLAIRAATTAAMRTYQNEIEGLVRNMSLMDESLKPCRAECERAYANLSAAVGTAKKASDYRGSHAFDHDACGLDFQALRLRGVRNGACEMATNTEHAIAFLCGQTPFLSRIRGYLHFDGFWCHLADDPKAKDALRVEHECTTVTCNSTQKQRTFQWPMGCQIDNTSGVMAVVDNTGASATILGLSKDGTSVLWAHHRQDTSLQGCAGVRFFRWISPRKTTVSTSFLLVSMNTKTDIVQFRLEDHPTQKGIRLAAARGVSVQVDGMNGFAIDSETKRLFITNMNTGCVHIFKIGMSGGLLTFAKVRAVSHLGLQMPVCIALGHRRMKNKLAYVCEWKSHSIAILRRDAKKRDSLTLLGRFGGQGVPPHLKNPLKIVTTKKGLAVCADWGNKRLLVFRLRKNGEELEYVRSSDVGSQPVGLCVWEKCFPRGLIISTFPNESPKNFKTFRFATKE
eukprot:g2035.t1